MTGPTVSEIGEFALIGRLTAVGGQFAGVPLGPGDDAAVVAVPDGRVVACTDMLVEGRHFRLDWSTPEQVGHKAIAQNAADIYAMGAHPTAFLVALGCPADTPVDVLERLNAGIRAEAELLNAPVSSPYGNPIPGLAELGIHEPVPGFRDGTEPLSEVIARIGSGETVVQIARMSEHVQSDSELLTTLHAAGVIPGVKVTVAAEGLGVKLVPAGGAGCEIDLDTAGYLFVTPA